MTLKELSKGLKELKVLTGSLICLGCGHEHNCSTEGCAIVRAAGKYVNDNLERIERTKDCDYCKHQDCCAELFDNCNEFVGCDRCKHKCFAGECVKGKHFELKEI